MARLIEMAASSCLATSSEVSQGCSQEALCLLPGVAPLSPISGGVAAEEVDLVPVTPLLCPGRV